jgi:hypothetical protein
MPSINIFFLADLKNLTTPFDSDLDQPKAKRLLGWGSYPSHSLPLRPAFGSAMVDIFFDVSKSGGKIKYLVLR